MKAISVLFIYLFYTATAFTPTVKNTIVRTNGVRFLNSLYGPPSKITQPEPESEQEPESFETYTKTYKTDVDQLYAPPPRKNMSSESSRQKPVEAPKKEVKGVPGLYSA